MPPVLLLTRPAAQAERFAAAAGARFGTGLRIVISPLTGPEFLSPDLPLDGVAGLVFTSETGVEGFARLVPGRAWPVHCVGAATARAAKAAGFPVAVTGPGDAAALADAVLAAGGAGPLVWPCGQEVAFDLAQRLTSAGLPTRAAVVYRQAPRAANPAALAAVAGVAPVVAPLFSPAAATRLAEALPDRRAPLWLVAMSGAVAETATALTPARLVVAARPDADAMLEATAALIDAAQPA